MERRVRSMVTNMRFLYAALVRLHPPAFRRSYGPEMLSIFDHTPSPKHCSLSDATISLLRQWLLRPEFHQPVHPSARSSAGACMFCVLDDDPRLTRGQWMGGLALSLLNFAAASFLIAHAGTLSVSAAPPDREPTPRRCAQ